MVVDYSKVKWNCPICKDNLEYIAYTAFHCKTCKKGFSIHLHESTWQEGIYQKINRIESILSYLLSDKLYDLYVNSLGSKQWATSEDWEKFRKEHIAYITKNDGKPIWE